MVDFSELEIIPPGKNLGEARRQRWLGENYERLVLEFEEFKERSCSRKIKYPNRGEAKVVRNHLSDNDKTEVYFCAFCHNYHIGHVKARYSPLEQAVKKIASEHEESIRLGGLTEAERRAVNRAKNEAMRIAAQERKARNIEIALEQKIRKDERRAKHPQLIRHSRYFSFTGMEERWENEGGAFSMLRIEAQEP